MGVAQRLTREKGSHKNEVGLREEYREILGFYKKIYECVF
jgi:hypothetical protein